MSSKSNASIAAPAPNALWEALDESTDGDYAMAPTDDEHDGDKVASELLAENNKSSDTQNGVKAETPQEELDELVERVMAMRLAKNRVCYDVPFDERVEFKRLGGLWHGKEKYWYVDGKTPRELAAMDKLWPRLTHKKCPPRN